jgi:uncharacterized membrane protein
LEASILTIGQISENLPNLYFTLTFLKKILDLHKNTSKMGTRPKIKIALTPTDKLLETSGLIVLGILWIMAIWSFYTLPETIPSHFNAFGKADGFSGKITIIFLPIVGTLLYFGISFTSKYPQFFNYPVQLTPENAERQYANALRMIRCLRVSLMIIFTLLVFQIIESAHGKPNGLGYWFLPLVLALVFIPMIYFTIKALRDR